MGDTGSLFLGFILGVMAMECSGQREVNPYPISFLIPLIALGFPILDTGFVFFRRLIFKKHLLRADKSHIHHWLSGFGFNQRKIVLILYLITFLFVVLSFTV